MCICWCVTENSRWLFGLFFQCLRYPNCNGPWRGYLSNASSMSNSHKTMEAVVRHDWAPAYVKLRPQYSCLCSCCDSPLCATVGHYSALTDRQYAYEPSTPTEPPSRTIWTRLRAYCLLHLPTITVLIIVYTQCSIK